MTDNTIAAGTAPAAATQAPASVNSTTFAVILSLSFCHLLNDMMQSLVPALYPILKDSYELSFSQVGLITLAFQFTASMLQPVVGLYTDRKPQPYSLMVGMGFTLVGLFLMSCTTLQPTPSSPSLFPLLGTLSPAARAQVVQSRTTGLQTLTAVLAVSYTVGKQRGTFDMIVNYAAPGSLRFTALKDTLLSTQVLFDLLLTGETYRLLVRDNQGDQISQGPVLHLASAYPTFRTFFVVGEAFFLPGFDGQGQPPRFNAAGTRAYGRAVAKYIAGALGHN